MRLVFFGPPGSGKGTQAELASEGFGMVHLSTGALFREEIQRKTELGMRVRGIMESGSLIRDDIVNEQVFSRIDDLEDFLLDGYPRNVKQAADLDGFLDEAGRPLTGALLIEVPDEEVMARLAGRMTCTVCGGISGSGTVPSDGECDECGGRLEVRDDDRPEVVRERLRRYREETGPLRDYYGGRMQSVDGVGTVDEVAGRISRALSSWR
jgi:adenylate kinase